ncbi:prepilin peptidase [Patescibacteria group bacterium]|nr:prepilin peptidase [Patescibacteria group bacterium]
MELVSFFSLFIFLFGLAVGSFLNSIIHRLHTGESFLFTHSYCPHCKHKLSWQDLIPILSFLILKGKCRYCKKKVSLQYPLVESATGILFILTTHYTLLTISYESLLFTVYCLLLSCFLIIIFVYDLKHYIIPDKIIYPAIGIAFIYNILYSYFIIHNSYFLVNSLLAAFTGGLSFLFIFLLSGGKWMGFGDVKLVFFMGLFLSFPDILVALFLAFLVGAIIGIGLISAGKKTLKSEVPFGPFLVTGAFIAFCFGNQIVNWYLKILR